MTEVATKLCSECNTPLTVAFYGYGDCGMHTLDEYESVQGYRIDATDGMGDWEDGPTWLWVPLDRMPEVSTFHMTKERCCGRWDLDPLDGESDYCPKCREVMEPASAVSQGEERERS